MISGRLYIPVLLIFLLTACGGPTEQDVIDQYQARFDEEKEELKAIASSLPPQGQVLEETSCPALDPLPSMYFSEPYNTGILMEEQLTDPHAFVNFSLASPSNYIKPLQYTDHSLEWMTYNDKAEKDFYQIFEETLKYEYLIINRVNAYSESFLLPNTSTYIPGEIDMDVFLVSLQTNEILCNFHINVSDNKDVLYQYEEGTEGSFEANTALENSLKKEVMDVLTEKFGTATGSKIKLCEVECFGY